MAAGCTISATNDGIIDSLEISTEIPDEGLSLEIKNLVYFRPIENVSIRSP